MKMKKNNFKFFSWIVASLLLISSFTSCSDDDSANSSNPPVINSVSASVGEDGQPVPLTPTNIGYANNVYIIQGSGFATVNKVYFNDTEAQFNPNFVTDATIFVTININTPYANASNKLKVVTAYGTAEYDFVVAPPAPQIASFNSVNAADGDTITIYGSFFLNPTVTVGGTAAQVVSSTLTEVQAILPANSFHKYVTVTTISGSSTSAEAIGTSIYDDERASFVENWLGPWDGSGFVPNTEIKVQGESSIEVNFTGYTGFKFPMYAAPVSTSPYKALRMYLKSTKETGKVKVVLNNNYGAGKEVTFTSSWTYIEIPFADLGGAPAAINEIVLQEFNNDGGDKLYFDNIGFVLN